MEKIASLEKTNVPWVQKFLEDLRDGRIRHVETRDGKPLYRET